MIHDICLCLTSFIMIISRSIHVPTNGIISFFLWLNNIPLCICTTSWLPGSSVVKNSPANAGDTGSIPDLGRSFGEGHVNPLQYSCLEIPMNRGAWHAIVHEVAKIQTWLSSWTHTYYIFNHSSVDRLLGHFHILAIVNCAALNIGAHVSFGIMVFSRYMPMDCKIIW